MEKTDLWASAETEELRKKIKAYEDEKLEQWLYEMR